MTVHSPAITCFSKLSKPPLRFSLSVRCDATFVLDGTAGSSSTSAPAELMPSRSAGVSAGSAP
eukprot:9110789-Lingulodinium_polyedra.AAC.1